MGSLVLRPRRQAGEPSPFKFTYHFSFGVQEFAKTYTASWPQVPTNKIIGVMWPNDADGNAIRAALGPAHQGRLHHRRPGRLQDGTNDYSSQIATFKSQNCEMFNTFPIPPDFATFWRQAAQQGYKPKIAQIAKTGLFPSQLEALGEIGYNLAGAAYWAPNFPYRSSLTGVTSKDLASGYEAESGKQWNQQLGPSLALFDVAAAALKASGDPKNKEAVAAAMKTLQVDTALGTLSGARARWRTWCRPSSPTASGSRARASTPSTGSASTTPKTRDPGRRQARSVRSGSISARRNATPLGADRKRFGALTVLDGVDFAVGPTMPSASWAPTGPARPPSERPRRFAAARSGLGLVQRRGHHARLGRAPPILGIGRAHQVPRPFGDMTVFENVLVGAMTGAGLKRAKAYERSLEVLEDCGLLPLAIAALRAWASCTASGSNSRVPSPPVPPSCSSTRSGPASPTRKRRSSW